MKAFLLALTTCAAALPCMALGQTQDQVKEGIDQYREMLKEGNPGELYALKGEALFKEKRGPKKASLESCNLGLGPGVVKGAYAQLPRYFADTGRVQDLESRLVTCMVNIQGFPESEATKRPFGNADKPSDMEYLAAYIVTASDGIKMNVNLKDPHVQASYELGKKLFNYRAGTFDFSCATCHGENGKRIRLQDLPNLTTTAGAQATYTTWPAYRVSVSELKTFQWRLNDCYRQQRFPEPGFASDATIALTTYLAASANGAPYQGPGLKR